MKDEDRNKDYTGDSFDRDDRQAELDKKCSDSRRDARAIRRLRFISAILIVLTAVTAYRYICNYLEIKRDADISEKARAAATSTPLATATALPTVSPATPTAVITPEPTVPPTATPRPLTAQIAELRGTFANDDIVAYLKIDDTNIDYAVAQSDDNNYYLTRDLYGNESSAGTLFADYENDLGALDRNTIIYGHNMRNGSMFHNLRYYRDKAFFEEHRYIKLTTPSGETTWEVFAFCDTDTDFNYIQVTFPFDVEFERLLKQLKEKSMYDTGVEVSAGDKILSLSTCTNVTDDARYVLSAKLIEFK